MRRVKVSDSTDLPSTRLRALGHALRLLDAAPIDEDDPEQRLAYYLVAEGVVGQVIATPAVDLAGLRIKAEAVAWCCASRSDFALGDSFSDRAIGSLLRDLLAA